MRPRVSSSQTTVPDTDDNVEYIASPTSDTGEKSAEQETAISNQCVPEAPHDDEDGLVTEDFPDTT